MRRSASPAVTAISGMVMALMLASCGSPASGPATSSPAGSTADAPTASASGTATAAPGTTAPEATATPAEGWKTFTAKDGSLSFDYPADWTIKDPAGQTPAGGGVSVDVSKADGKSMATLRTNVVTGAECTKKQPYGLLDSQSLPALAQAGTTPRFTFESRTDREATDPMKATVLAYGITSAPEPAGPEACPIAHFFTWPPSGAMFGGVYNPFDTSPGNEPHVDTPEAYKETAEYKNIRRMITSLRPAG
ncbi:hypothetical protein J2809_002715 [Arthrobacter pascens]|uniref:hypothetical protein n=1 Tax=Arthrobacter pascens TaxID=1677 RepID=UPI00285DACA2|nr:hypothetical protein [Arthrobacter pascens]MDR6558345.1 hypothetical protein [Arthrobacter pascens]